MSTKPFSPKQHGLNDYGFVALQLLVPPLLGFNKKAVKLYRFLGFNLLTYNALTDTPVGIRPVISYQTHKKIDIANVAGLAAATLLPVIRKEKKVLAFHLGFVALAAVNILLTDWDADTHQDAQ